MYQAPGRTLWTGARLFISTYGFWDAIIASPATEKAYFLSTSVHAALGAFTGPHPEPLSNINWPGSAVK